MKAHLFAAALLILPTAAGAQPVTHASERAMPMPPADYVAQAAAGDMFEIQSSQLALTKAKNPEVKAFAAMMVDHHTKTSADLKTAAAAAGIKPPEALPEDKAGKLKALADASADDFDALYVSEQIAAHAEARSLHKTYGGNGDNAALKAVALKAFPIVEGHLEKAKTLAK